MIDARAVSMATGWSVSFHRVLGSTNDEAARLRDAGAPPRTAVVAEAQTAGRGRAAREFASPPGGLYASLLLAAGPSDLPGPLTAAVAVAAAEAVEGVCGVAAGVKWPNDLWVGGRKVAGILLEAAGLDRPVVAGIGVNVRAVPASLPPAVRSHTTCLDAEVGSPVDVGVLLTALLRLVDLRVADLADPVRRRALEERWRSRLLLMGEGIRFRIGDEEHRGVLRDARLAEGLLVEEPQGAKRWRRSEHVQDVRPAPEA